MKSVSWAFSVLELSNGDFDKINEAYRKMARLHHPDIGGSEAKMKELNEAKEVLEKAEKSHSSRLDWDKLNKENTEANKALLHSFITKFKDNEPKFIDHLFSITNKTLISAYSQGATSYWSGYTVVYKTEDKKTKFQMNFSFSQTRESGGALGSSNIGFQVGIDTVVYHNDKLHKLSRQSWKYTRDHAEALDPEKIFPRKKVEAAFERNKEKPVKKSDFMNFLVAECQGSIDKDMAHLYTPNNYRVCIYRTTMMRLGAWNLQGVYIGRAGSKIYNSYLAIPETRKGMQFIRELMKLVEEGRMEEIKPHYEKCKDGLFADDR